MNNVGKRLREIRKHYNLTQSDFAKRLGITKTSVYNYESEERNLDSKLLLRIIEIFNVDVNWLLNGNGDMLGINNENGEVDYQKVAKLLYPGLSKWEILRISRFLKGIELRTVRNAFDISLDDLPGQLELMNANQEDIDKIKAIR